MLLLTTGRIAKGVWGSLPVAWSVVKSYQSLNLTHGGEGDSLQASRSRSEDCSFFKAIAAEWDLPQWHISSNSGRRDFPREVIVYITRGGVSG